LTYGPGVCVCIGSAMQSIHGLMRLQNRRAPEGRTNVAWRGTFFVDVGRGQLVGYCKKCHAKELGVALFALATRRPTRAPTCRATFQAKPSFLRRLSSVERAMPKARAASALL